MQIARYSSNHKPAWGFVEDGGIRPAEGPADLVEALGTAGALAQLSQSAGKPTPVADVQLLAPIPNPPQFVGVGLNYRKHALESGADIPTSPVTFPFFNSAIANPGDPIELPPFSNEVDWEVELGIVIGKGGRDIAREHALDHVAGYVIINDVSARDIQMSEGQWSRAKSFDTFKPMGPWMTTTDVLGAADGLDIKLWVNGDLKQSSSTSDLIFDVPDIVSFLSGALTLQPGMVISTGTPEGVGFARTPPEYLKDGDSVTLEIEGIGTLTNPVVGRT